MIATPDGLVPPLTAARMAARYAALEAKGNQGAVGRMDNARRKFQREEFRCLKGGQLDELDALRRSQFARNPSRRGSTYAAGWGFYCPDGAGHAFLRPMLDTPHSTPDCTPRPAESVPRMTIQHGHATSMLASRSNAHIESLGGCSSGGLPLPRGLQPPPSRAIPYPEPRVGAAAAPFAKSHNTPSMSSGRPAGVRGVTDVDLRC